LKGFAPTQEDVETFNTITPGSLAGYDHLSRWFKQIASFPLSTRQSWPGEETAEKAEKDDEESDEDSDDDDDDLDFDAVDDDDDEETKALLAKKQDQIDAIQARQKAKEGKARSNLTLDVKPIGSETDMDVLQEEVRALEIEGVKWLGGSYMDVAYGVQKLRIMCQLVDVLVSPDDVREALEDLEEVQSTDVFAFQMA